MSSKNVLVTTLLIGFAATAHAQDPEGGDYGKHLDNDMQMAAVVAVSDNGDLVMFGGTVVVPFQRPSVEKCGVHMSMTAAERANELRKARREATDRAVKQRYSPAEKAKYVRMATKPIQDCERRFNERCKEIKSEVSLEVRKGAVERVRDSIDKLAKGPTEKKGVVESLNNVLAACPLTN